VSQLLQRFGPEFRVFVGLEELSFPMLAIGAAGLMNAVGNLAPRRVARLYDAVASGALGEGLGGWGFSSLGDTPNLAAPASGTGAMGIRSGEHCWAHIPNTPVRR